MTRSDLPRAFSIRAACGPLLLGLLFTAPAIASHSETVVLEHPSVPVFAPSSTGGNGPDGLLDIVALALDAGTAETPVGESAESAPALDAWSLLLMIVTLTVAGFAMLPKRRR